MIAPEKIDQIIELFKKKTEKQCYKICFSDKEPKILDDKVGGKPYLPVGEEYPKDKNGNPLGLLLQVNLKNIDLRGWQNHGILEIFADNDWKPNYQIRLFEEGQKYKTTFPKILPSKQFVSQPMAITLEKATTYMSSKDYRFSKTITDIVNQVLGTSLKNWGGVYDFFGKQIDEFCDRIYDCTGVLASVGGYADFVQSDPRFDMKKKPSECVFKLDSSACGALEIGDSGIVCGYITKSDLTAGQLEKMIVSWDCC